MENSDEPKVEEWPDPPADEIDLAVEKGSPGDNLLQVLKHKGIDAEITAWHEKGGPKGGFQLVQIETIVMRNKVASACTIWAIILPSRRSYILSSWGPGETDYPLDVDLFGMLRKDKASGDATADVKDDGDEAIS